MHILVTGADGFIGSRLGDYLTTCGHQVRLATRRPREGHDEAGVRTSTRAIACGEVNGKTDWSAALRDIEAVIHLVAPAHRQPPPPEDYMDEVNVDGSVNLFRQMRDQGVRRMVYLSTIKVNGERTQAHAFKRTDAPRPQNAYARSKHRAETALMRESAGAELVIVRSPLVHGPGVKGNLLRLMRLIRMGAPLPLRSVDNRRSMVGLRNLHSFLEKCATHQDVGGNTVHLVSDGEDVSTPNLVRMLCRSIKRKAYLWPVPVSVLRALGRVSGRADTMSRLCDNLQVDMLDSMDALDWQPPQTLYAGLQDMTRAV